MEWRMANAERTPLWKRWWVWCVVCLVLAGVVANETKRLREAQKTVLEEIGPSWFSPAGGNSPGEVRMPKPREEPSLSDAASDGTTGKHDRRLASRRVFARRDASLAGGLRI